MEQKELAKYFPAARRLAVFTSESRDPSLALLLIQTHKFLTDNRQYSEHTMRAYRKAISDFLDHMPEGTLVHLTPRKQVLDYVTSLSGERHAHRQATGEKRGRRPSPQPLATNTIIQRLSAIRALFAAFIWVGLCKINPADRSLTGHVGESKNRLIYYRSVEILDLLEVSDNHDKSLILLAAHGGLRASELSALRWNDISFTEQTMQISGNYPGIVNLSNRLAISLQALWDERLTLGFAPEFVLDLRTQTGLYKRMKVLCKIAGTEFKGVQALRNSCGRMLTELTGDAQSVQQHLRLRSIEQVQRYIKSPIPLATTIAGLDF